MRAGVSMASILALMLSVPAGAKAQSFADNYASYCLGYVMLTEPIVEPYSNCACVAEYLAKVTPPKQLDLLHRAMEARNGNGGFTPTPAEAELIRKPIDPGPEGEFAGLDADCPDARLLFDEFVPPQPWD